ncbi:MAG: chemotaxis protein CheV [Fretibacterium sp.]|nr:chemotaxis protein CheV [Fretibacterium sp.]
MKSTLIPTDNKWEVVVFTLGNEAFAINVNKTREILRWTGCRPVPKTSPAFVGITTVRGVALPLVDLRLFLGIESPLPLEETKVMVVEFNDVRLGFLVDAVERIHSVSANDLDSSLTGICLGPWVLYVMKRDSRNILLLDYEAIVQATSPSVADQMLDENLLESYREKLEGDVSRFRILVADDSPLLRQQLQDVLARSGFEHVHCALDGVEAYELLMDEGQRFDLLITDIEMPRLDGLSLIELLRKEPRTQSLPVILYSSIMVQGLLNRADSLNTYAHILKPDVYQLVESVVRLYNETTVPQQSEAEPA